MDMNIVVSECMCLCGYDCIYTYMAHVERILENENNTHNFPLMPQNRKLKFLYVFVVIFQEEVRALCMMLIYLIPTRNKHIFEFIVYIYACTQKP